MRIKTKLALVLFFVALAFAATGCASMVGGRYVGANPYPGPLGQVVAGNFGIICPGDVFIGQPINRCLRHLTNIGPQFAGYPMFAGGQGGRPLSRGEKIAIIGGTGAVVGGLAARSPKGAIIGGVVGAVMTAVATRGNNRQSVVTPPSQGGGQQGVYIGPDGVPVAVGTRPGVVSPFWGSGNNGRPNCLEQGMATLENQAAGPLRVYRNTEPFEVLLPKESKCAPMGGDYTGEVVGTVVSRDGLTGRVGVAPAKPQGMPGLVLVWR